MSGVSQRIDLAAEPDFDLGGLRVSPSACKVQDKGREERVEPRVMEVLVALTKAAGRTVSRDELIQVCWDGRAVSDDAVSRIIAKVRQLGRNAEPAHFTLETVPKVGFRFTLPPAIVTQAETAAPEGVGQASKLQHLLSEASRSQPARLAIGGILSVAVVMLIAAWAFDQSRVAPINGAGQLSVSRFTTSRALPELERLARNAPDALIRALSDEGVPNVSYSRPTHGIWATDAEFTLAGNVDYDGATYRINSTINHKATGLVLWSRSFEREASVLRGLEEEAARGIADVVRCALHERTSRADAMSLESFTLFLKACGSEDLNVAHRLVEQAPQFAGAHALFAIALETQAIRLDHLSKDAEDLRKRARVEAEKALSLDPRSVLAYVASGATQDTNVSFAHREKYLRRALEIDPDNKRALHHYSFFLRQVGRVGAARELLDRSQTTRGGLINGAFLSAMRGELNDAEQKLVRLAALNPDWASDARWPIYTFWEAPTIALAKLPELTQRTPQGTSCIQIHLTIRAQPGGHPESGLHADCAAFSVDWRIRMLAQRGQIDVAYELINRPWPNSRNSTMFLFYPEMQAFRRDWRFMPLTQRLGLLAYWHESGNWPDFCAEPGLPYDCKAWRERHAPVSAR